MTTPGPITGRLGKFDPQSVPYKPSAKRQTPRCPGPDVWWCPVEDCTTVHPPRPDVVSCRRCAGTGEYPPTGGDECSWCDGEGEVATNGRPQ